jgi:hypothetical protein
MPRVALTTIVTLAGTASLVAWTGFASSLTNQACAQNKPWGVQNDQQKQTLPQTKKLEQNDNLDPTVNRTQAMRTEAETGTIAPITGTEKVTNARPKKVVPVKIPRGKKLLHQY